MLARTTEMLHQDAIGLDQRPLIDVASILVAGQIEAARAVETALPSICDASEAIAQALAAGRRLFYVAAGSSGLMAAADAQELGGTYSIPSTQLRILMAGGLPTGVTMPGETEDATNDLTTDLTDLTAQDVVVAVSASGSTPFTLAAAQIANARNATLIAIANNPETPLLKLADHPILIETPPEVVSGSTRMGAATAQKIVLNMLSTMMALRMGHVHDGMMVNVYADNAKLRARAKAIVTKIANVDEPTANDALALAGGRVKPAILIAAGAADEKQARALLAASQGHLRPALEKLAN